MGRDATVNIWFGMELDSYDELPEPLRDIETAINKSFNTDYLLDGLAYSFVDVAEQKCGFGVMVFSHDWDYGVKEFDLVKLQSEIDNVAPRVRVAFKEWGLPDPKLLLQTDYF